MDTLRLNNIEEAIEDFREGKFVIVVDDEDRENEGDLICAAEKITPDMVNFMLKYARGVLCAPITISRSEELDLPRWTSWRDALLAYRLTTALPPFRLWPTQRLRLRPSDALAISTRCMHRIMACCVAVATRRRPSTCVSWLDSTLPVR